MRSRSRARGDGRRRCGRCIERSRGVMTRDVHLVLVEYGREHEDAALALLQSTIGGLFPDTSLSVRIVDNASADGDNSVHEFSAWDLGLSGARGFSRASIS